MAEEMHLVYNDHQRLASFSPLRHSHFFQLVQSTFDIQQSRSLARTSLTEISTNIILMVLIVKGFAKTNAEDFKVCVRFKHSNTVTVVFSHGIDKHTAFPTSFLAYQKVVVSCNASHDDGVNTLLLGAKYPVFVATTRFMRNIFPDRSQIEDGVTWLKSMCHLLNDEPFVGLVVDVTCSSETQAQN
ncbi:hypothetical protein HG531_011017 [Fusarium graminearum]|nr:hypothetical protein HG531_011017 [Fusarium graminearum]